MPAIRQSRGMSFVYAVTTVIVGFGLGMLTQAVAFPLFGIEFRLSDVARSYAIQYIAGSITLSLSRAGILLEERGNFQRRRIGHLGLAACASGVLSKLVDRDGYFAAGSPFL